MACMFTMMNRARLAVGLQGVGIAERATQQALAYARERRQGRIAGMKATESAPIIAHPDVRRMLLTMRALTQAARGICYATAMAIDRSERGADEAARQGGARARFAAHAGRQGVLDRHRQRGRLAWRAGAWRHGLYRGNRRGAAFRDARIAPIYEGTNGIQAIDLVTRKLPLAGGARGRRRIATNCAASSRPLNATNDPAFGWSGGAARRRRRKPVAGDELAARPARQGTRRRRSPAQARICGCSASPPAAAFWRKQALAALRLGGEAAARARAGAVLCREFCGPGRRARAHRCRRRAAASSAPTRRLAS